MTPAAQQVDLTSGGPRTAPSTFPPLDWLQASRVQVTRSLGVPWTPQSTTHSAGVTTAELAPTSVRVPQHRLRDQGKLPPAAGPSSGRRGPQPWGRCPALRDTCQLLHPAACHDNGSCGPEAPGVQENKVNMPPPSPNSFSQLFLPATSLPLHTTGVAKRPPVLDAGMGRPAESRAAAALAIRGFWESTPSSSPGTSGLRGASSSTWPSAARTSVEPRAHEPWVDDAASSMSAWTWEHNTDKSFVPTGRAMPQSPHSHVPGYRPLLNGRPDERPPVDPPGSGPHPEMRQTTTTAPTVHRGKLRQPPPPGREHPSPPIPASLPPSSPGDPSKPPAQSPLPAAPPPLCPPNDRLATNLVQSHLQGSCAGTDLGAFPENSPGPCGPARLGWGRPQA
ncbi:proline-rich protein 36-like [Cervus canadensis]|uniref:proline-rich protein 36-like n=1 Tax=Cervus canadensis TaxID=1574408 RepID=UPI001C9E50B4|nr:proline-rich protein 36-like [Cervus canadensis]